MAERVISKDPIGVETITGAREEWTLGEVPVEQQRAIYADPDLRALVGLLPIDGSRPSEPDEEVFIAGQAILAERYGLTSEQMFAVLNDALFIEKTPRAE